jgi:hypothetical protein
MDEQQRKMAFTEIGKKSNKSLVAKVQSLFEEAQLSATERHVQTSVTLRINIIPPVDEEMKWGKVTYSAYMTVPKEPAREFVTELRDGIAIESGDTVPDILQYALKFHEIEHHENVTEFPESVRKVQ